MKYNYGLSKNYGEVRWTWYPVAFKSMQWFSCSKVLLAVELASPPNFGLVRIFLIKKKGKKKKNSLQ